MPAPFRIDPSPKPRGNDGRFIEQPPPAPGPPNPLSVEAAGGTPQNWAPGIGQNTAPIRSPAIPWGPANTGTKPFKVGQ